MLKQTFDDREISRVQIGYWVIFIANRILSQHIMKRDSGAHMTTVVMDTQRNPDLNDRVYVELPGRIFDFDMDKAIRYMSYFRDERSPECPSCMSMVRIGRVSAGQMLHLMNGDADRRPSAKRPLFYREGNRLYICGPGVSVRKIEAGLNMSFPDLSRIDINQPFNFPDETLVILHRQVMELGRLILSQPGEDLTNDGAPRRSDAPVASQSRVSSLNDPFWIDQQPPRE
jgi:hypothetical protein